MGLKQLLMLHSGAIPVPNSNSMGFFDECINVKSSESAKSNITGQYCLVTVVPSKSTYDNVFSKPPMTDPNTPLATCVPNACQPNDTQNFLSLLGLEVTVDETLCQTKRPNFKVTPTIIVASLIFSAIFLGVISCTIYEIYYEAKGSLIANISLRTNFRKLVAEGKTNQMLCLHGIRTFSVIGVILYHVKSNETTVTIANSWYIPEWSTTIFGAILLGAPRPGVLSFFVMSGFLVGYSYMKLLERNGQLKILNYYLHRYFRLTASFAAIILFYVSYLQYVGSGPYWPTLITQQQVVACDVQWWMALLYIQNIFQKVNYCVTVSWYITIDMQLYILSPLLFYIIKNRPQCFLMICKILLLGSLLYTIFVVLYFKPAVIPNNQNRMDTFVWYKDSLIVNCPPWLIGIALSYLVITNQKKNVVISKKWLFLLWTYFVGVVIVGVVVNSILISNPTNHPILQPLFLIFYPFCWSIAIAWVIFACLFNYAVCINNFLSWPVFQFVSKLSYSMYLLHEVIVNSILGQYRFPIVFGTFETLSLFCISFVIVIFVSVLLTLFVEWPGMMISEYFFKKQVTKQSIMMVSKSYTEEKA